MLDIGFQEVLVLMVIALLIFGPDKLPDLGRRLGRAMREFRRASDEFRSTIETNLQIHDDPPLPPSASSDSSTLPELAGSPGPEAEASATAAGSVPGEEFGTPPPSSPPAEAGAALAAESAPLEPFCARRGGRLLHRGTCAWVSRIPEAERAGFKEVGDGWEQGLRACPVCAPEELVPAS